MQSVNNNPSNLDNANVSGITDLDNANVCYVITPDKYDANPDTCRKIWWHIYPSSER